MRTARTHASPSSLHVHKPSQPPQLEFHQDTPTSHLRHPSSTYPRVSTQCQVMRASERYELAMLLSAPEQMMSEDIGRPRALARLKTEATLRLKELVRSIVPSI
jgi:hypothetical protein